jgi:hypothetical protein
MSIGLSPIPGSIFCKYIFKDQDPRPARIFALKSTVGFLQRLLHAFTDVTRYKDFRPFFNL